MGKLKVLMALIAVLSLLFLMACQQQTIKSTPVAEPKEEIPEEAGKSETFVADEDDSVGEKEESPAAEHPLKEFTMTANRFEFNPSVIEAAQGDRVRIKLKSLDVTHGFSLTAFGISERLEPGVEVNVEFIADRKGEFAFFCSVPCGSGHGAMKGKLIVK